VGLQAIANWVTWFGALGPTIFLYVGRPPLHNHDDAQTIRAHGPEVQNVVLSGPLLPVLHHTYFYLVCLETQAYMPSRYNTYCPVVLGDE